MTETMRPTKLKIFTLWSLTESLWTATLEKKGPGSQDLPPYWRGSCLGEVEAADGGATKEPKERRDLSGLCRGSCPDFPMTKLLDNKPASSSR